MKKLVCLFLMLCLMAGCMRTSRHPQLVAVDSLLISQPDSALMLLRQQLPSFGGTEGGSSSSDRMYYYLLLADACNKCYDTLPSDSIMHLVADFYDAHGTPNEQVRAHYLLGCVYRDLGEAPQALDCYHTALDRADTTSTDCNYRLLMSVYGQMADLFHRQNLPQDEIWALELSGKCNLAYGDTIGYIQSIELTARAYFILGDTARVIETINKSKQLYLRYKENNLAYSANGTLAYILLNRGETDKARVLLDEYEFHFTQDSCKGTIARGQEMFYGIKSAYYLQVHKLDSAEFYARKLIPFNYKADAYRALLTIFEQRKNTDSIIKYARLYEDAVDTLNNRKRTEVVGQMSSMYNYQRFQKIADMEARNAERARHYVFVISLCCVVLFVCLYAAYARYKRNKHVEIKHIKEQYESDVEKLEQAKYDLMKMQEKEITHLIEEKAKDICQLQQQIGQYEQALSSTKTVQQLEHHLEANGSYARFRYLSSHPSEKPTEEDWQLLRTMTDELLPDFKTTIYGAAPGLKQADYDICLLVRLYFSPSEVAMLTDNALSAITMKRRRLLERLFHQTGKAETFDRLIRQIR